MGCAILGDDGSYAVATIRRGPDPRRHHTDAWRPAQIRLTLFGTAFTQRLITQTDFPGDPLLAFGPICQSITDPAARARVIGAFDHALPSPETSLGDRWDIVLTDPQGHVDGERGSS